MTQKLFSVRELAVAVGCSRDSVWRAIRRGEIETLRFGSLVKIRGEEFERITTRGVGRYARVAEQTPRVEESASQDAS